MKKLLYAKKLGMTQLINENGSLSVATVVQIIDGQFVRTKTTEKDGYSAAVIAFDETKAANKPTMGQLKSIGKPYSILTEIKIDATDNYEGHNFDISQFEEGQNIKLGQSQQEKVLLVPLKDGALLEVQKLMVQRINVYQVL